MGQDNITDDELKTITHPLPQAVLRGRYANLDSTREIGIRMALGAQGRDVLALVLRQGMKLVLLGIVIGLPVSLAVTQVMKSLLFGLPATDPITFAVALALLTSAALMACYIPARRATKVDPLVALRYE